MGLGSFSSSHQTADLPKKKTHTTKTDPQTSTCTVLDQRNLYILPKIAISVFYPGLQHRVLLKYNSKKNCVSFPSKTIRILAQRKEQVRTIQTFPARAGRKKNPVTTFCIFANNAEKSSPILVFITVGAAEDSRHALFTQGTAWNIRKNCFMRQQVFFSALLSAFGHSKKSRRKELCICSVLCAFLKYKICQIRSNRD